MIDPSQTLPISVEFSDEQLLAICEAADVIICECPAYLVRLLQEVREFQRYSNDCIEQFPEDATTHHWLSSQMAQIESLVSKTIFELMNRENLLDTYNQLNLKRLSERNRQTVLTQAVS